VATFLPLPLGLLTRTGDGLAVLVVANALMCTGLAWSLWSLWHLGRSLSLVAQARTLVCSGPYGAVRHPLYVGELAVVTGAVIGGFTWPALVLLVALAGLQLARAGWEEAVLGAAFPEYAGYRARTPRIVPRLPRLSARPTVAVHS
ncbi:MAG: methyltransferase family protein, partial [Acidimicrobiales bacterium]